MALGPTPTRRRTSSSAAGTNAPRFVGRRWPRPPRPVGILRGGTALKPPGLTGCCPRQHRVACDVPLITLRAAHGFHAIQPALVKYLPHGSSPACPRQKGNIFLEVVSFGVVVFLFRFLAEGQFGEPRTKPCIYPLPPLWGLKTPIVSSPLSKDPAEEGLLWECCSQFCVTCKGFTP
jgi:hypothetical protein